jgi:hypothetical protein
MPDATVVASPYKVQVEATAAPQAPMVVMATPQPVSPSPAAALPVALLVVPRVDDSALLLAPDPHTLETRRDVAIDAIGEAWALLRPRVGPAAVGTVIVSLASAVLSATVLGALLLGPLQGGGFGTVALRAAAGHRVDVNDFFEGFARGLWPRLVVSGLLVSACIFLGSVALVVPGLYLAMATAYTPLLVIDRDMDPWPALKDSVRAVNDQLGGHIALFLGLAALNFVGSLACGLGVLVTIPLSAVALGVCYRRVFGIVGMVGGR